MNLYLDDDSVRGALIRLLERGGHDVLTPADVALVGADDSVHMTRAIYNNRVLLSHNHDDFNNLHDLVIACGARHPGILMVRQDNDPKRDMTPRAIVRAIDNLLVAKTVVENQFVILNQWRQFHPHARLGLVDRFHLRHGRVALPSQAVFYWPSLARRRWEFPIERVKARRGDAGA